MIEEIGADQPSSCWARRGVRTDDQERSIRQKREQVDVSAPGTPNWS
ncbi:hypothetical protein [Streptomyces africanus]|nr:hypothetical protein [Streptomyces africanus]